MKDKFIDGKLSGDIVSPQTHTWKGTWRPSFEDVLKRNVPNRNVNCWTNENVAYEMWQKGKFDAPIYESRGFTATK